MTYPDGATDPQAHRPGERPEVPAAPDPSMPALDLAAALGGLDRATRNFSRRLGERHPRREAVEQAPPAPQPRPAIDPAPRQRRASADDAFGDRLLAAEREAREYLEQAKRRADTLVNTMVAAVEQEAGTIRREAEESIRMRWQQVEVDAGRHLAEAKRMSEAMVSDRQQRISTLSDGITRKAEALTTGLTDAERVRMQFDVFVRSLSLTAGRIAADPTAAGQPAGGRGEIHDLRANPQPSALAA